MALECTGRRTKIVATLGPVSGSPAMIGRLIDAGVNIFRLNFSHGTHEFHAECIKHIRTEAAARNESIGILQDLQGPKIRIGELLDHQPVELVIGAEVRITTEPIAGVASRFSTTYEALPDDVRSGQSILLDDGRLQLEVKCVNGGEVVCAVTVGGLLLEHKGMNLPQTPLSTPSLTEKDHCDLRFGLQAGVDFIGLSFVRRAGDLEQVRSVAREMDHDAFVIAKIECVEAIANLDEIISVADGIMVARGDLGVETSAAEVPLLQKRILDLTSRLATPDITATQMLESMVASPRPTRAEATDVANAVFDGSDAVMLSAETAIGRYPVEAVATMARITTLAEQHLDEYGYANRRGQVLAGAPVAEATVHAACFAARETGAKALALFTMSGKTAFLAAGMRPNIPILACTSSEASYRQLALAWGVRPVLTEFVENPADLIAVLNRIVCESGLAGKGDRVIMLSGTTPDQGATNIMRIHDVRGD